MHRIHVRAAFAALALVSGVLIAPATAGAQMTPQFAAFGTHGANANLMTMPLGAADCAVSIPFTFTGTANSSTMRYIDVWWSSSSQATCNMGPTRMGSVQTTCNYLGNFMYTPMNMTAMPTGITPMFLFSGMQQLYPHVLLLRHALAG